MLRLMQIFARCIFNFIATALIYKLTLFQMKGFQPISWICLAILTNQASSAPPRNAVMENAATDLNVDPNNIQDLERLQNGHTDNKQMGSDINAGSNTGLDSEVDGQILVSEKGIEITAKGKTDKVSLQNGNAADVSLAETAPVLSETVQGTVEKELNPILLETGEAVATGITKEGKGTAAASDPNSNKESAFICIEIVAPDAIKAGLMHQAEKASSKSSYDKLGKIGTKVDTLFKKLFQTFVGSKIGPGSIDKLATTVSLDTSFENTHQIEKGNAAKNPFSEQTVIKGGSNIHDAVDMVTDILHDSKQPTKNFKVFTGEEARHRSKEIFANLQNVGDKLGQVFNEFFPGLVNVKISTGPKSKSDFVRNNFLKKDTINNVYIPSDIKKGDMSNTVKDKSIKTFDKVEKGIDSIIGGIKPFINRVLQKGSRRTDFKKQKTTDTLFDSYFHTEMESLGRRISSMIRSMFNKSFMKDKLSFGPSQVVLNAGLPPSKPDKPVFDASNPTSDKIPTKPAMKQESAFTPSADMQTDQLVGGPYFSTRTQGDPTFDPYLGMSEFQRRIQGIYSDLVQTMVGPFIQSFPKTFSDSLRHTGQVMGKSKVDKFTDPLSPTVV